MRYYLKRSIVALLLLLVLLIYSNDIDAGESPSVSALNKGPMSRIISIVVNESKFRTTVNILGDGKIPDYITKTYDFPPKIVVDIFCAVDSFETTTIASKSPNLKSITVGHHPKKIRLVLDIKGADIPDFITKSVNNELNIILKSQEIMDKEKGESNKVEIQEQEVKNYVQDPDNSKGDDLEKTIFGRKLTQIVTDDGRKDTSFFLEGLNAYGIQDWSGAIENLTHLIKTYPAGRYVERAYFLRAESYEQLHSQSFSVYSKEIKHHFENAINKFPTSEFVPDAIFSIGNLYFKIEDYFEALGYYSLVIKKDKDSILTLRALIQKGKIFLIKKRREEILAVLSIFEDVISGFPDIPEIMEAKKEMSKILYGINSFHKSINILTELKAVNPDNIYQYPEISLYLGYNYYQLGDNVRARENLFRFYNSSPDREMNHLVLTQIGDAYRNEGLINDALKLYRMVLGRYPDTEGAVISQIRLAEQIEKGNFDEKISKEIGLSREIYEDIVNSPLAKDEKNSLRQLALFKLAITHQKEKEYYKSLKTLKLLLTKYPKTSLKRNYEHVLLGTIDGLLKEDMKNKKYSNVINLYQSEKELFLMANNPELFLTVARACIFLGLESRAVKIFKKADLLLSDKEKPPDLLFFLGRDLFKQEKLIRALTRLNLLIDNHPSNKYVPYAYQLKGSILAKQKKCPLAAEMFSTALRYPVTGCDRARILTDKAKALTKCSFNEKALKTIKEVEKLIRDCDSTYYLIYKEIGDLYLHLGYTQKALNIFNKAIEIVKEEDDKILLKLKVAQCYRLLNKREDSIALYDQISKLDVPFWSNLAKDRLEEINFHREMRGMNLGLTQK